MIKAQIEHLYYFKNSEKKQKTNPKWLFKRISEENMDIFVSEKSTIYHRANSNLCSYEIIPLESISSCHPSNDQS